MKILSKNKDTYFLKVDASELANIIGMSGSYSDGFKDKVDKAMADGSDVDVSEIYRKHASFTILLRQKPYSDARKKLESMLDDIKPIEDLIQSTLISKS